MSWKTRDTIKWKREGPGHYYLYAWYLWQEPEIHAEIKKEKGKWAYSLWTWGSEVPTALPPSHERFKTAKEIKQRVIELILEGKPCLANGVGGRF